MTNTNRYYTDFRCAPDYSATQVRLYSNAGDTVAVLTLNSYPGDPTTRTMRLDDQDAMALYYEIGSYLRIKGVIA